MLAMVEVRLRSVDENSASRSCREQRRPSDR